MLPGHSSADLGLALNCQYDLSNRTIVNDFDLAIEGEIEPSMFEEAVVDSPNVLMKITRRGGGDVDSAQVGNFRYRHKIRFVRLTYGK